MSVFVEVDLLTKHSCQMAVLMSRSKNIDLKIKKRRVCLFAGHSGCGKSTLLNIVAVWQTDKSGCLEATNNQARTGSMVVFQNYSLPPF